MTRCVIDASVAAEFILRTTLGRKIAEIIEGAFLAAPELLDVEVLSVLRRAVLRQRLEDRRARLALDDLATWPMDRIPHAALLREAWLIVYFRFLTSALAAACKKAEMHDQPGCALRDRARAGQKRVGGVPRQTSSDRARHFCLLIT